MAIRKIEEILIIFSTILEFANFDQSQIESANFSLPMENIDWIKTADEFSPPPLTPTPIDPQSVTEGYLRAETLLQPQTIQPPEEEEKVVEEDRRLKYSDYVEVGLDDIKLEEKKESPLKDINLAHSEIVEEEFKDADGSAPLELKSQLALI